MKHLLLIAVDTEALFHAKPSGKMALYQLKENDNYKDVAKANAKDVGPTDMKYAALLEVVNGTIELRDHCDVDDG